MGKQTSRLVPECRVATGAGRRAGLADVEIGQRIRSVRMGKGITQEYLADRLLISCQQLQKYENGANRISAARLVEVARHLNTDVATLLQDEVSTPPMAKAAVAIDVPDNAVTTSISGQELMELLCVYCAIPNPQARAKVFEMAKFLSAIEMKPV